MSSHSSLWNRLTSYAHETFKWRESRLNKWHSALYLINIGVPAVIAWSLGQPALVFIGALGGMLFSLSDSGGSLRERLLNLAYIVTLMLSFGIIGALISGDILLFWLAFLITNLFVGWLSVKSHPQLAAVRDGAIALVSVASLPSPDFSLAAMLICAAVVAACTRIIGCKFFPEAEIVLPKPVVREPLDGWNVPRFCVAFALATGAGMLLGQARGVSHPAWVVTTILLVMQPDVRSSVTRIIQRAFGTALGVAAAALTVTYLNSQPLIFLAVLCIACALPHAATRNYWLQSAFIAWLILVLYDFAAGAHLKSAVLTERIGDVLWGCLVAFGATTIAFFPLMARKFQSTHR